MNERKVHDPNFQDTNDIFVEEMWQLTPRDINTLKTIVYWVFGSTVSPEEKYFFVKNWLFSSNYREKIGGKVSFGGRYQYLEEVDTGNTIDHDCNGVLTSESWNKIFEFKKELKQIFNGEFI